MSSLDPFSFQQPIPGDFREPEGQRDEEIFDANKAPVHVDTEQLIVSAELLPGGSPELGEAGMEQADIEQLRLTDSSELVSEHAADAVQIDEMLELAGGFGAFQTKLMAMLGYTYGTIATVMMEPVFLTPVAVHAIGLTELQARTVTSAFFAGFFVGLYIWSPTVP